MSVGPGAHAQTPDWSTIVADTNDPLPYIRLSRDWIKSNKDSLRVLAESALVVAARLDPASSQPPYLLAIATIWRAYHKAANSWRNHDVLKRLSAEQRARFDSLMHQAWLRDPFFDLELDPLFVREPVPHYRYGWNRTSKAYFAYYWRDFDQALAFWAQELTRKPDRIDLRFHRVHTFYRLGQYANAAEELRTLLRFFTASDSMLRVLPPTEILYYSLGVAYEKQGRPDLAREAYSQALVANLGLYMAHARLANLLLDRGDTTGALQEVAVAVDVAPHEPLLIALYGALLLRAGRFAAAQDQFRAVIALSPRYASPYMLTGMVSDSLHQDRDALESYELFLAHAPQRDERRAWTQWRVAALRKTLVDSASRRE